MSDLPRIPVGYIDRRLVMDTLKAGWRRVYGGKPSLPFPEESARLLALKIREEVRFGADPMLSLTPMDRRLLRVCVYGYGLARRDDIENGKDAHP